MGGDAEPEQVDALAGLLRREQPKLKIGWYSGRSIISPKINKRNFDYIKVGPFLRHLGPLTKPTTNQRLHKVDSQANLTDITPRFWRKKE